MYNIIMKEINYTWDQNKTRLTRKSMAYLSRKREKCLEMKMLSCSMTPTIRLRKIDFSSLEQSSQRKSVL